MDQKPIKVNFLSHFYFDRDTTNCYHTLGIVLPDLLKNADKTIILHPEKLTHPNDNINSIIKGWEKHLEVDKYFHSSSFFRTNSHQLKQLLLPAIEGSPVKPFFLGHITIELILDNLLLTTQKINIDIFYDHLDRCEAAVISEFLIYSGLKDTSVFFKFYESFKKSRYLYSYAKTEEIAFALKRICMRIWKDPFTHGQEVTMNEIICDYRSILFNEFMSVFYEIKNKLTTT